MDERTKVAPWERYADGHWHVVRTGPQDEPREESLRVLARHRDSAKAWAARKNLVFRISRKNNGQIIRVLFAPKARHAWPVTEKDLRRVVRDLRDRLLSIAVSGFDTAHRDELREQVRAATASVGEGFE
jgi:hypothetical protein